MDNTDRRLLETVGRLASQAGRPPTFDEVAVEAGFSSRSRGAVYRRLARLRGEYVDWDDQAPRSLRLLSLGETRGGTARAADVSAQEPIPRSPADALRVLGLIASGLVKLCGGKSDTASRSVPGPLRRGLNRLAVWALLDGKAFPGDFPEAISLLRSPLERWPLPSIPVELDPADVLLVGDEPSELCYELSVEASDAEAELTEQIAVRARERCRVLGKEQAYVRFRRFLIEHPTLSRVDLVREGADLPLGLPELLYDAYEPVPDAAIRHAEVQTCGVCGWTLTWTRDGEPRCDGRLCAVLTKGFNERGRTIPAELGSQLFRVKRGIRRYIVAPGKAELRLAERLAALGLDVTLWPAYDAYDLRVGFPSGEAWAVDVKDWENPFLLAKAVGQIALEPSWNQAYYVFPDYRASLRPRYARAFGSTWVGQSDRVGYAVEKDFLRTVRQHLTGSSLHA